MLTPDFENEVTLMVDRDEEVQWDRQVPCHVNIIWKQSWEFYTELFQLLVASAVHVRQVFYISTCGLDTNKSILSYVALTCNHWRALLCPWKYLGPKR